MSDPFESIISECIISPAMEEALNHAPEIGEHYSSNIFTLDGLKSPLLSRSLSAQHDLDLSNHLAVDDESPRLSISPEYFEALINCISRNPAQRSLGRHDILKITVRKGLSLSKPKWWHPGGYDKACLHFTQESD